MDCDDDDDGGQNENDFDDGELNDTPRDDDIYMGNDEEVDDPYIPTTFLLKLFWLNTIFRGVT